MLDETSLGKGGTLHWSNLRTMGLTKAVMGGRDLVLGLPLRSALLSGSGRDRPEQCGSQSRTPPDLRGPMCSPHLLLGQKALGQGASQGPMEDNVTGSKIQK